MLNFVDNKYLPVYTDKPCWWCGYSFKTSPIGLPIRYYPSNGNDSIKDFLIKSNLSADTNDFFETEGIFCSFPCCKAFMLDKHFNTRYKNSMTLISLLYYKLYNERININAAPSWKLLKQWGGSLSIEEFRESFCKYVYCITSNIKRPFMFSTGVYIEEIKINTIETI